MANAPDLEFCVLSPEEIKRLSVLKITQANLFRLGIPVTGSLTDLRLGTCSRNIHCATCKHSQEECLGHNSYIDLAEPVMHYLCLDKIARTLSCVCFWCSKLLIDYSDADVAKKFARFKSKKNPTKRLAAVASFCKGKLCAHCGGAQPKYKVQKPYFHIQWEDGQSFESKEEEAIARQPFRARQARDIIAAVPEEALRFLGYDIEVSHPKHMILTRFLFAPVSIIAPHVVKAEASRTRGIDDLALLMRDIVKYNQKLEANKESLREAYRSQLEEGKGDPADVESSMLAAETRGAFFPEEAYDQLLLTMGSYFDADGGASSQQINLGGTGVTRTTQRRITRGAAVCSLGRRLGQGKQGRLRKHVFGKRVNYSSRTVITGDSYNDIHILTVPHIVALTQYVEVRVNYLNLKDLRQRILRGSNTLRGAHHVIRPDGSKIHLTCANLKVVADSIDPTSGWIVARLIDDGDTGLFNRQPTLHKQSIMALTIKLPPAEPKLYAFKVNCALTPAFNADFDGDEMNLHIFSTDQMARAENAAILDARLQIISSKNSQPILYLVQDARAGAMQLTNLDTFLTPSEYLDLCSHVHYSDKADNDQPAVFFKTSKGDWSHLYTGKQVMSYGLSDISMKKYTRRLEGSFAEAIMDTEDRLVYIEDGCLLRGRMDKTTMGGSARGIIQRTFISHDAYRASNLISDIQRLCCAYLKDYHGLSIGIDDCLHSEACQNEIDKLVESTFSQLEASTQQAKHLGYTADQIEMQTTQCLSSLMNATGTIVCRHVPPNNPIRKCIESGAKGKSMNLASIHGVVGQQLLAGCRPGTNRAFLSTPLGAEEDPRARGFVTSSYTQGLTPREFFVHAMGGREGLVDTACRTAETGYIQRRLEKNLESLVVQQDSTVRLQNHIIIQSVYGGDGLNCEYLMKTTEPLLKGAASDARLHQWLANGSGNVHPRELAALRESLLIVKSAHDSFYPDQPLTNLYLPFDFKELICEVVRRDEGDNNRATEKPTPDALVHFREQMELRLLRTFTRCEKHLNLPGFCAHLRFVLRAHLVYNRLPSGCKVYHLQHLSDKLELRCLRAAIEPHSAVGGLAATSIGEPATQICLNTFHQAGKGSRVTTGGIAAFSELINATQNPKRVSCTLFLHASVKGDRKAVERIARNLQCLTLSSVLENFSILYDPITNGEAEPSTIDAAWLSTALLVWPRPVTATDHVIRLVLDRSSLAHHAITVRDVERALRVYLSPDKAHIVCTHPANTTDAVVVRIRLLNLNAITKQRISRAETEEERLTLEHSALEYICIGLTHDVRMSGLRDVHSVFVEEYTHTDILTGEKQKEYVIETDGPACQLEDILASGDLIDPCRSFSSNMHTMLKLFGIEALIQRLTTATRDILSSNGDYISPRHTLLLATFMCWSGKLLAVTRNGMSVSGQMSVLTRASFEQTLPVLINASAHGVRNRADDMSAAIILGQTVPCGTGCVHVRQAPQSSAPEPAKDRSQSSRSRKRKRLPFVGAQRADNAKIEENKQKKRVQLKKVLRYDFWTDPRHMLDVSEMRRRAKSTGATVCADNYSGGESPVDEYSFSDTDSEAESDCGSEVETDCFETDVETEMSGQKMLKDEVDALPWTFQLRDTADWSYLM